MSLTLPLSSSLPLSPPLSRIIHFLLLLAVVCWLALDTAKQGTRQLVSFCGILLFVSLTMLFSKYPLRVRHAHAHTHTHLQIHTLLQINYHVCDLTFVAVVRANFVMGDRATVSHLSADAQDYIWLKWTAVAWKTSRGIQIHTCTQMCVF